MGCSGNFRVGLLALDKFGTFCGTVPFIVLAVWLKYSSRCHILSKVVTLQS